MGNFDYIGVDIETNPDVLEDAARTVVENYFPGYQWSDTDILTIGLKAKSQIDALMRDAAAELPQAVFRSFGANLANLPPYAAVSASFMATFTLVDTLGYLIPVGTQIKVQPAAGPPIGYMTSDNTDVPAGTDSVSVQVEAIEEGVSGNFTASASVVPTIVLLDSLNFVTSIVMTANVSVTNGVDDEDDAAYRNRLRADLSTLTETPVTITDYTTLATYYPGVGRAIAVDQYDPGSYTPVAPGLTGVVGVYYDPQSTNLIAGTGTATTTSARTVSVFVLNADGTPLNTGNFSLQSALAAFLNMKREIGFRTYVMSPDIAAINVVVSVIAYPAYSLTDVAQRVLTALTNYINPLNWGSAGQGGYGSSIQTNWTPDPVVSYLKLAQVIQDVDGVYKIKSGTLKADKTTTPTGTTDITIASGGVPVALPALDLTNTTLSDIAVTYS